MRTFLTGLFFAFCLALSIFGGADEAQAQHNPVGGRFCSVAIENPADLIARTNESLAADPSGNRALRGCAATPNLFLESYRQRLTEIRRIVPDIRLDSARDLPAFYARFVELQVDRDTEYKTDCLQTRNGRLTAVKDCETRYPRAGERIYGIRTAAGEIGLLMQSCVNPGATPVEITVTAQPCIEVHFPSMGVRTPIRFAYIGRAQLPGRCHQLTMAGAQPVTEYPTECRDSERRTLADGRQVVINCVWDQVEAAVSERLGFRAEVQNVFGSFYTRADGTNILRLPPEALDGETVICWELPDGTIEFVTLGARRMHFRDGRVAVMTVEHVRAAAAAQ